MLVGVDGHPGTKAAQGENQQQALHPHPKDLGPGHALAPCVLPADRQRHGGDRSEKGRYHLTMLRGTANWRASCSWVGVSPHICCLPCPVKGGYRSGSIGDVRPVTGRDEMKGTAGR